MSSFFIKHPTIAIVISIVMILLGGLSLMGLPIEQYPNIVPPTIKMQATYPGANAETVANSVASPIEQSISGVVGMDYMTSTNANNGICSLSIVFEVGTDPNMDQTLAYMRYGQATAQIPAEVSQMGITITQSTGSPLAVINLYSPDDSLNAIFLSNYAYVSLVDPVKRVPGVGDVQVFGAGRYAMRIWLDTTKMAAQNISVGEVQSAIQAQNTVIPGGQIGAEPAPPGTEFTYSIQTKGRLQTAEEFGNIIIRAEGNKLLYLKDIAKVELGSQTYNVSSKYNGRDSGAIAVYAAPGSNAINTVDALVKLFEDRSRSFPAGMEYNLTLDTTLAVRASIEEIEHTLVEALLLVVLVVFVFLQGWRATLIPAIAVPVSIIATFALFPLLGFTLNTICLMGMVLAIGLVVDDAIVVVEAVQVNIEKGLSAKQATVEAMHSVSSPIVATTVVLLAVFIPVSFMGSITGLLFQQFSISIAVSVCISSFNALTLSPALCALLLKPRPKVQKGFFAAFNRWFGKRTEEYTSATTRFIGHLKRTGGIVAVTLAAIAVIWHFLPSGFLPDEDQGYVMVFVQTPEASSLQTTVKAMQRVDELVRQRPDVEATSFAAGFNMLAGIASSNSGIIFVKLVDYSQRSKTSSQIASALTEELYVAVPEAVSYAFISPSIPGLGVTSGITLQVQDLEGRGTEFLADETMRFMDSLRKQPQIGSVTTQFNAGIPQRRIEVDKEKALAQGVPLRSFYKTMSTLLGGSYINNFNRFGKLYQTYIQAAPEYRRDKYSLESYFVDDGQGNSIPVSSFTTVRDTTGVEFVSQFNLYRSIELTVNPAAKVSTGQAMDAIEAVAADVLPEAVGTTWSGLSYQEKTASGSSGAVYLLAIVFVFLTLSALYNSWGLPLAILLSVPLAVLGALLFVGAAYLVSPEFINNIYMQISLVMLIGLSAKNAILVVEYADQLFFEKNMDLKAATIEAARLRMRPIMMTAFSFILGVMPLIFASGVYATARNIMGMALVGGMLLATMLGIFIYPALYYLVARVGKFERKRELKQKES